MLSLTPLLATQHHAQYLQPMCSAGNVTCKGRSHVSDRSKHTRQEHANMSKLMHTGMKLIPSRVACTISFPDNFNKCGLRPVAECPVPAAWLQKFLLIIISSSCGSTLPQDRKAALVRPDQHVAQTLYLCSPHAASLTKQHSGSQPGQTIRPHPEQRRLSRHMWAWQCWHTYVRGIPPQSHRHPQDASTAIATDRGRSEMRRPDGDACCLLPVGHGPALNQGHA